MLSGVFDTQGNSPFYPQPLSSGQTLYSSLNYNPIITLLALSDNEIPKGHCIDDIVAWALEGDNLCFGNHMNIALSCFGRDVDSLSAEICLLLVNRNDVASNVKAKLVQNGLQVARECKERTERTRMFAAQAQVIPVLTELERFAVQMEIKL